MRTIAVLLFSAGIASAAEPPQFQVENKIPTFTVENKTGPADPITRMNKSLDRMLETVDAAIYRQRYNEAMRTGKPYVPPPCQQCNRGDVQCACPLNYGVCRCGELTKAQPVEVRRVPFVQPGSSSTPIISAMPAAGRSSSYPASTRMGLIRIGAPAAMYGGTNCGPSG